MQSSGRQPASGTAKSDERRSVILDRLADYVLANGLSAASLRPLAEAAGTSDRMLLYYFKDKAVLMSATLGRVAERLTGLLNAAAAPQPLAPDALLARLHGVLLDDSLWPYMSLWLEIASLAARNDPFYRALGEQIGRGFLAWGAAQLDSPSPAQRAIDAARLLAMTEGMVLLKSLGLDDVCRTAL